MYWIYIERKSSSTNILKLGKKKLLVNNVLIVEINNRGIIRKKNIFDKDKMNNLKYQKILQRLIILKIVLSSMIFIK